MRFHSILFEEPGTGMDLADAHEPGCFADLNLDQVLAAMIAGREEYDLTPFFYTPLHEVEAVRYRHEIMRDLERSAVFDCVGEFARAMRAMREQLDQAKTLHYRYPQESLFLDAVDTYCQAVRTLAEALSDLELQSRGLQALHGYLSGYIASDEFTSLAGETRERKLALAEVRYCVHIKGNRIRVSEYDGEADYSAEVLETFAKFKQGAVQNYRLKLPDWLDMNHVEAQVLDVVARLNPEVFLALDDYCARHRDYLDATIGRFDREVQFLVAYLEYIEPFKSAGLTFCYPHVGARSAAACADRAFDLALATKAAPEKSTVVCNDFHLNEPERILVVTGPNQGGKTTFARMFGQLHYLAGLGYPVPGSRARLSLPDRVFTHFEVEEDLTTLRGKLEDELFRVHEILQQATRSSIIVMNESFTSTTLSDALLLGTEVITQITELGSLAVYVTFVDELASVSDTTVSMVSTVLADNPAERTFRIVRKPADGLAYAAAIAEKYGLTYTSLRRRITR